MKIIILFLAVVGIFYFVITTPEEMDSLSGRYQSNGGYNYQFVSGNRAIIYFGNAQVGSMVPYRVSGRLIEMNPCTTCRLANKQTHRIFYLTESTLLSSSGGVLSK